jgi:hypothetical protein
VTEPQEARGEILLSYEELAVAAGIRPTVLARLIRLGVVEPVRPESGEFTADTITRVRRMLRLHAQLGVNFTGAAVILDLLDRLERLERAVPEPSVPTGLKSERPEPPGSGTR